MTSWVLVRVYEPLERRAPGDVNGDGYDDLIVGAFQYDNGEFDEGRAYVYLGSPSGPSPPGSNGDCDSTQP